MGSLFKSQQVKSIEDYAALCSSQRSVSKPTDHLVSKFVALLMVIPGAIILAALFVLHKLLIRDGGPFIYRGVRLGKDRAPFMMYKVRTLAVGSETQLRGKLHQDGSELELKHGRLLRKTRLDEIPQIYNVLKGDMVLVGPRPVRPCVYEAECRSIRNYDLRFSVPPGLTGLSQFLTPHDTSKALRARVDNVMIRKLRKPWWPCYIILWTALILTYNLLREVVRITVKYTRLFFKRHSLARPDPERPAPIRVQETDPLFTEPSDHSFTVLKIRNRKALMRSRRRLKRGELLFLLFCRKKYGRWRRVKCWGVVNSVKRDVEGGDYTIVYEPISDLQEYRMNRYVLESSLA